MSERYEIDECGQVWCYTKRGRVRAILQKCEKCLNDFHKKHKQMYCSAKCRSDAQKGVPKSNKDAICKFCEKPFKQALRARRKLCCSKECVWNLKSKTETGRWVAENNPRWKGGKKTHAAGYVMCYVPGRRYMLEHRYVMEQMLGRKLESFEEVHHKNGIRNDNRPENLELWAKRQPGGQRVSDLIEYAKWVLETYEPIKQLVRIAQ